MREVVQFYSKSYNYSTSTTVSIGFPVHGKKKCIGGVEGEVELPQLVAQGNRDGELLGAGLDLGGY